MKKRVTFLMFFVCVFLLTQSAISGTWTGSDSNKTFSFNASTVSTSSHLPGMTGQAEYWEATGSANISGTAIEYGNNTVYDCELWLMASGDLGSSPFPGKDNIDTKRVENGVNSGSHTSGNASISYRSHPVGSLAKNEFNPLQTQAQKNLSDSLSAPTYSKRNYTSPTGLCASPEVHGSFSGSLMNFVGAIDVKPLSFQSEANKACATAPDNGSKVVADEKCDRKRSCQKPGTAKSLYSHRVECGESIRQLDDKWAFFGVKRYKRVKCESKWWTCDDIADVCPQAASHILESDSRQYIYVDTKTGEEVDPSQVLRPCGHSVVVSGDHSLQASCSSTDSNGNSCTVTSFYACDNHSHVYPVRCANSWTGSGACSYGRVVSGSDAYEHRLTCAAGHTYWSCNPSALSYHSSCQSPQPSTPAPSTPAPSTPAPTVVCPANSWTSCGGTVSHETTCGSGHTYYTCNPSAVSWHTADRTCSRTGCNATYTDCSRGSDTTKHCLGRYYYHQR